MWAQVGSVSKREKGRARGLNVREVTVEGAKRRLKEQVGGGTHEGNISKVRGKAFSKKLMVRVQGRETRSD